MLDDAETEREIVEIVRDCIAELMPDELKALPEDCWPGRIRDQEDIVEYAFRLGRRRVLSYDSLANAALVDDLFTVLSHAGMRIGLLQRAKPVTSQRQLDEVVGRPDNDR